MGKREDNQQISKNTKKKEKERNRKDKDKWEEGRKVIRKEKK